MLEELNDSDLMEFKRAFNEAYQKTGHPSTNQENTTFIVYL